MRRPHPDSHRPIAEMFEAERPHLQPLPARYRTFCRIQ
jgi:hypothetical protein